MIKLKKYFEFIEGETRLTENIRNNFEDLVKSLKGETVDIFSILGLNKNEYMGNDIGLDYLYNDSEFNDALNRKGYKKDEIRDLSDISNFILQLNLSFFCIFKKNESEIDNADFIIFNLNGNLYYYKITGNVYNFYDKISTKKIKVIDSEGSKNIYTTDDVGETWYSLKGDNEFTNAEFAVFISKARFVDYND